MLQLHLGRWKKKGVEMAAINDKRQITDVHALSGDFLPVQVIYMIFHLTGTSHTHTPNHWVNRKQQLILPCLKKES